MSKMSEYRIGSRWRGAARTVLSFIGLAVVPVLLIRIIDDPSYLDTLFGRWIDVSALIDRIREFDLATIRGMLERALWTAAPMIVLAYPVHYYDEGNKGRMYARMIRSLIGIARYLYIIDLGDLPGIIGWSDPDTDAFVSIDLAVTGYLLIRIALDLIDLPLAWAEMRDNRARFLEEHTDYYGNLVNRTRKEIREFRRAKARGERSRTPGTRRHRRCSRCTSPDL